MSDLHRHRHRSGSHRSREGSHSSHSNGGGALARPRRNYKLISDPSIDLSCSEKQYRFEGVVTGHSPIEDPIDPRSIGGRFVLGAREFPVPRFVYDEFSIGDPPQRDVFISGINDNLREDDLTKLCQKMGEVHSVQVYYHPERKAHLGGATVSFLKSTGAMKALKELSGKKMMGQCLQVQIDDNGEIASDYKKSKLSSQPTLANTQSTQPHPSDPRSVPSVKPGTQAPVNPQPLSNPTPLFPPAELLALMHSSLSPFIPLLTSVGLPQTPEAMKDPNSLEARLEKLGMFPVPPTLSPPPPPPPAITLNPPPTLLNTPPPPPPPVASPPAPPPLPKQTTKHHRSESNHSSTHSRDRSSNNSSKSNHRKHSPSQRHHHSPCRDRDRDRERDREGGRDRERVRGKSRDRERGRHRSRERERHYDRDKNREEKDRHRRRSKSPSSHRHSSKRSHVHPPMSHASFNLRHPLSHASISAPSHKKSHHSRCHSSKHSTPSKHDPAYQAISDISSDETNKLPRSNTSEHNTSSKEQNVPLPTAGEEDMDLDPDVSETAPVIELFQPQQKQTDLQRLIQQQVTQVPQNVVIQLYLQSLLTALNNAPVQNNSAATFPTQTPPSPAPPPAASPHTSPSCQELDSGEIAELLRQPLPPGPISLPATMSGLSKRRQLNPMCPVPVTHADNVMNHLLFHLSQELRSVLCKDITRRLIEQTAYKSFEKHWGAPDIRLDIYGPQARKGGSSSGAKSQELVSTLKNDGSNNKHRGPVGVSSPTRAQPPARYKIPLLAGFRQQRRSLSNMNRMRRSDNRGGVSRQRSGRWRDDEKREREHGRRDKHRSASSDDSPERKRDKHVKPIKRVISLSSSDGEKGEQATHSPSVRFDTSLRARSFSSPSSSNSSSSSSSSSPSSSPEYSSQSESEQEYSKPESPTNTAATADVDVVRESSVLIEGLVRCEGDSDQRRDSLLTSDSVPTPLKQKSTSPHEDSDSDTYSPPPPLKVDGNQSWNLNGKDTGPAWFSVNDPASWTKDPSFLKKYAPALKRQPLPQTRRFPRRPPWEQNRVRDKFLEDGGFDEEDTRMMQYAFVRLKSENCVLLRNVNYAYHPLKPETTPPTLTLKEQVPLIKRKRTHKQLPTQLTAREHLTGSVRTEGLYRLTLQEKLIQRGQLGNTERLRGWKENFDVIQTSRDSRATQRRLATELGWADINSDFAKNLLRTRKKMLCFAKSTIHNWGLFTLEPIAVDELVIEYIGECIRSSIGDVRERRYQEVGIGCSYMFRVDSDYIIDATKKGNLARFINHSCDPNCYAKIIPVGTEKRIAIYSKRDIEVNEEITYDYKFPLEDEKIPCYCGATTCRGTLN